MTTDQKIERFSRRHPGPCSPRLIGTVGIGWAALYLLSSLLLRDFEP